MGLKCVAARRSTVSIIQSASFLTKAGLAIMKPQDLAHYVPQLHLAASDVTSLIELADTLVAHSMESYSALLVSPDGHADVRQWKELRRKDGIHVFKERSASAPPSIPSLLLLGTVVGKLHDVMLVAAASTDEQMKLTSRCLQDGVLDSKVLQSLVRPSVEQPFRHVGVKWRLHNARDYVCVDATGVANSRSGEPLGYSISHSVAFSQVPSFDKFGVERANMSVCSLFRQKTPETVECYARGFFDFRSDSNELLNSLSMNAVATQWLSFAKYVDCAEMKKIVWRMRKNSGLPVNGPMAIEPVDESSATEQTDKSKGGCAVCQRSLSLGFSLRRTCKICQRGVCSSCSVKKLVCVLAPDRRTVLEKKRTFCTICMYQVTTSDALAIAKDEISELQSEQQPDETQPQDDEPEVTAHDEPCSL